MISIIYTHKNQKWEVSSYMDKKIDHSVVPDCWIPPIFMYKPQQETALRNWKQYIKAQISNYTHAL